VAEAVAAEMVVADFDDELWLQRAPLRRTVGRPPARPARRIAGEAGLCDQRSSFASAPAFLPLDRRGEADVVQQSLSS
jgi:hypothetical protein